MIVGAGPTGVEMAGQIAELAHSLRREYRSIDTRATRVLLVEATDRVLGAFPAPLPQKAEQQLRSLGVTPMLSTTVVGVEADSVDVQDAGRHADAHPGAHRRLGRRRDCVAARPRARGGIGRRDGPCGPDRRRARPDRAGRPNVLALGDMVSIEGQHLHGVAPVAMQQGRHVARMIASGAREPFRYRDKGELATIGRSRAVGVVRGLELSGFLAWALWLGIHIVYLIGFQNRAVVLMRWTVSYLTRGRGARIVHRERLRGL